MIRILALVLALLPAVAGAQPYPALHNVTGVAADDVLNIRSGPSASTAIIGAFAPYQTGIEVVALSDSGRWGLVNTAERTGWVSMHYLARQPGQDWGIFPPALTCAGTEPFWSLTLRADDTLTTDRFGEVDHFTVRSRLVAAGRPDKFALRAAHSGGGKVTGIIAHDACSDGMSDRAYGLSIGFVFRAPGEETLYSGCCSLSN